MYTIVATDDSNTHLRKLGWEGGDIEQQVAEKINDSRSPSRRN